MIIPMIYSMMFKTTYNNLINVQDGKSIYSLPFLRSIDEDYVVAPYLYNKISSHKKGMISAIYIKIA